MINERTAIEMVNAAHELSKNPTFTVSFINTTSGQAMLDCGLSNLKTPKGAARNWLTNCGHALSSFLGTSPHATIKVIVRPIERELDCVSMITKLSPDSQQGYIKRELRLHGASVYDLEDVIS